MVAIDFHSINVSELKFKHSFTSDRNRIKENISVLTGQDKKMNLETATVFVAVGEGHALLDVQAVDELIDTLIYWRQEFVEDNDVRS